MEKLEHPHLVVQWVNALLGPILGPLFARFGVHADPEHGLIPDYLVMCLLIVLGFLALGLFVRSRLSVEHPSRLQIVLEDIISALVGLLEEWIGPKGRVFLPIVGGLGVFILAGNYLGLVPGFMSPTSNINVTVACAITTWIYYHFQGIRAQGIVHYVVHFAGPSSVPWWLKPIYFPIEVISHLSRVLSLSLRLFGNIFGEELIILILGVLVPYFVPLPMMALGMVTGLLQAFIFVLLSVIYLQGAVVVEHHDEEHAHAGHDKGEAHLGAVAA